MKEQIRYHALRLFDKNGFHGTSMRDIADAVGCKMPTVYHHFKNKVNLFDEVVRVAYIDSCNMAIVSTGMTPQDYCVESLIRKKNLSEDDLLVHRLALKTWLGCEGCDDVRCKLLEWESSRNERNEMLLADAVPSMIWVKIITQVFIGLVERIILFHDDISDDEIREEMRLLFAAATKTPH